MRRSQGQRRASAGEGGRQPGWTTRNTMSALGDHYRHQTVERRGMWSAKLGRAARNRDRRTDETKHQVRVGPHHRQRPRGREDGKTGGGCEIGAGNKRRRGQGHEQPGNDPVTPNAYEADGRGTSRKGMAGVYGTGDSSDQTTYSGWPGGGREWQRQTTTPRKKPMVWNAAGRKRGR